MSRIKKLFLSTFVFIVFLAFAFFAPSNVSASMSLGISGDKFTLNGSPTFLLGISAFDALGKISDQDLDTMRQKQFNLFRIWLYWRDLNVAYNSDGTLKSEKEAQLKELVERAAQRGLVVDVTLLFLYEGYSYPSFGTDVEKMRTAVRSVSQALKGYDNVLFDIMNEHDHSGNANTSHATIKVLMDEIKKYDSSRIVTVSSTGRHILDINTLTSTNQTNIREETVDINVDVLTPHFYRSSDWYNQTDTRINTVRSYLQQIGEGNIPIYLQEEERRKGTYTKDNFITAATKAKNAGAAGWNFHNEAGFDLAGKSLFSNLDSVEAEVVDALGPAIFGDGASTPTPTFTPGPTYSCLQQGYKCMLNSASNYDNCSSKSSLACPTGKYCCEGKCTSKGNSDLISNIESGDYQLAYLNAGDSYYIDRGVIIDSMPSALIGALWVKTANDDKLAGKVGFDLSRPAYIYVASDPRASNSWLSSFEYFGILDTSDKSDLNIYRKYFSPGRVEIGKNNCGGDSCSMYTVAISEKDPCSDEVCNTDADCGCPNYGDCSSLSCQTTPGDAIKLADGRNPAMAMAPDGVLHISYDCDCNLSGTCNSICYLTYSSDGLSLPNHIGSGWNSRIALDSQNNPHIVFQTPGGGGQAAVGYNKMVSGSFVYGSTGKEITEGLNRERIEKPRIAIDRATDTVYVEVQDVAKESVDYISFSANGDPAFVPENSRNIINDTIGGKSRPGNVLVDKNGNIHFTYSFYTGDQGIYEALYNRAGVRIQADRRVSTRASDFSDIVSDGSGELYLAGEGEWATGIFYSKRQNGVLPMATRLFVSSVQKPNYTYNSNIIGQWIDNRVYLVDNPDNLNTDIELAVDGTVYVSFIGAGNSFYRYKENINGTWTDVSWCDINRGEDYCRGYRYRTAYYFTVSPSGAVSDIMKVTPENSSESQQGEKYANPAIAAALNKGVFIAWEDTYESTQHSLRLKPLGGAQIGLPSQEVPGDLDKDGDVDIFDYNLLVTNFGSTSCGNVADIDGNCKVDIFDYNLLVGNFGK